MDFVKPDDPSIRSRVVKDGIVFLDGLLNEDEVAETRAQMERYEKTVLPDVPHVHCSFHEDGALRSMTEMQRYDRWFNEFGHEEKFWRLFRSVVDWDPVLFYLETFLKRPGSKQLRMHQELFAGPVDPPQYMHLWIALTDVRHEDAGMVFYPGSHRFGLAPHIFHSDGLPEVQPDLLARLKRMRIEPAVPAGSAVLFDAGIIHGSKANISGRTRQSLIVAVRGKDTIVHGDQEIFASNITRFFREEIGQDDCSADDDFRQLGGDDESASRVLKRIAEFSGVDITSDQLAALRTPDRIAKELIRATGWHDLNT
jgi:phytanoyl-CoA hydroxylase